MERTDLHNELFQLAIELVNQGKRNVFLTGKAGTGKTTFLRYIKEHSLKQTAVVAPTGVAAINAGGTTIHSFFQLPFSPYLPEHGGMQDGANNRNTLLGKIKLNRDRIKVLQQLELLVIDEVSMVRCDLLDSIDQVLRHFRHRHAEPFGGVQVLLIGDLFQLPPVAIDQEWEILSAHYASPFFFDSRVMQQAPPVYLEFKKIYRQQDDRFIDLLNQVRNNSLTAEGMKILDGLHRPGFRSSADGEHIILTTHNHKADSINMEALARLEGKTRLFKAEVEGDFGEKSYPADEQLQLKEGARVMFIKNDKDRAKRYFNGKIGTISRITEDGIYVQCKDEDKEIEVLKETWENIRYTVNPSNNQLEENVIGSFTQYPLRLAWAITIHKSQGLTFEKAVVDAGAAFASGQVYVALSRCTSLDGLVLQSRITPSSLRTDEHILRFSRQDHSPEELRQLVAQSKKEYQEQLLEGLFDFKPLSRAAQELKKTVVAAAKDFNEGLTEWVLNKQGRIDELQEVALKFRTHLAGYFNQDLIPEENNALVQRLKDAAVFFCKGLAEIIDDLRASPAVTDSRMQAKQYNEGIKDLFTLLAEKEYQLRDLAEGFRLAAFYARKKSFVLPPFNVNSYATAGGTEKPSAHPELHQELRKLRNRICEQSGLPIYMVASSKTLDELVEFLPQTEVDLALISGFGKAKLGKYGEAFLDVINSYCDKHLLASRMDTKTTVKRQRKEKTAKADKTDTKELSFQLFSEGKKIPEIAEARNLAVSTIESHLAHYVKNGKIALEELVEPEKLSLIAAELENYEEGSPTTPIIQRLNNQVTYGELRLAIAARQWKNSAAAS